MRRRHAAIRSSARILRHGSGRGVHLPVLLDALSARPGAEAERRAAGGMRVARCPRLSCQREGAAADLADRHCRRSRYRRTDRGAGRWSRNGFRVSVLEQSERLEETGAGIQLSPNATRTLIDLGLGDRLRPVAVAPLALRVMSAASGREIVRCRSATPPNSVTARPTGRSTAVTYRRRSWPRCRGAWKSR